MPLASYDYDYYEYTNGRRVNKATYATAPAKRSTTTQRSTTQVRRTSVQTTPRKNTATAPTRKTTTSTVRRNNTKPATTRKTTSNKAVTKNRKYDIDIPIRTSSKIINKPKEMTLKKPKAKKATATFREVFGRTVGLTTLFAVAFAICYRYSLINEEFIALEKVKKEYEKVKTVNEQIEADIESKTDLIYIENYAKYQLGMQEPSDSQKRYLNIKNKDKIITPVNIEEEESKGFMQVICEEIRKILD